MLRAQWFDLAIDEQIVRIWFAFDHKKQREWLNISDIAGYTGITPNTLKARTYAMVRAGLLERQEPAGSYYRRLPERSDEANVLVQKIHQADDGKLKKQCV